jgi:hypothetical protein
MKCPKCGSDLYSLSDIVHACNNEKCDLVIITTRTKKQQQDIQKKISYIEKQRLTRKGE